MNPLDKIYQEVNSRVNNAHELPDSNPDKEYQLGEDSAYAFVLGLIEELQEQKPQGLDEAAEKLIDEIWKWEIRSMDMDSSIIMSESKVKDILLRVYQAGAKWMAEQGWSRELDVKEDAGGYPYIPAIELYDYDKDTPTAKVGDKVIVQIRKK